MKDNYFILLFFILLITGCATVSRNQAPSSKYNTVAPLGFQPDVRYVNMDPAVIQSRFSEVIERRRALSVESNLDILALSGGGAGGSFGAGALVGFSHQGKRPQFDIVTGVSAGALIAPFAFLGSAWDARLADNFSGGHSDNFLVSRGFGILMHPSVYQNQTIIDFVDQFVTSDMISEVATQAASDRLLLVATTDLDKEETVIWDMGKIAAHGGETARTLFRDVLVASASIPGVFPPIIIPVESNGSRYDEMHVDGSVTTAFFIAPTLAFVLPLDPNVLKGANIYVLINGQLGVIPRTTELKTISILSRSISAELNHMKRTELALTSEFAKKYGMNFRLTVIPIDYHFDGPLEFQEATSRKLFEFGADCAKEGLLWATVEQSIARYESALSAVRINNQPDIQSIPACPLDTHL